MAIQDEAASTTGSSLKRTVRGTLKGSVLLGRKLGLVGALKLLNRGVRSIAYGTHQLQFLAEFGVKPTPTWFDHHLDQYYKWALTKSPHAWERGVFNSLVLKPGCRILELCSGDGFNTNYFYAARASRVVAIEYDEAAIKHARSRYGSTNIQFILGDIRHDIPDETFDNAIWDASIYQFTEDEVHDVIAKVKAHLTDDGVLSGQVHFDRGADEHTRWAMSSKEELVKALSRHFRNVLAFETRHAIEFGYRTNAQFFASDGPLPFDAHDDQMLRIERTG